MPGAQHRLGIPPAGGMPYPERRIQQAAHTGRTAAARTAAAPAGHAVPAGIVACAAPAAAVALAVQLAEVQPVGRPDHPTGLEHALAVLTV